MLLIDSHCHLDSLNYQTLHKDVDEVMQRARERDVRFALAVATTLEGFDKMTQFIGERTDVAFSCGVHPLHLEQDYEVARLERYAAQDNVVALGETGLDYFYQPETIPLQQCSFRRHIRLGRQLRKPLIVHSRDARQDTLDLLREEKAEECGGVLHCFTEDLSTLRHLLDIGFYISFSGIVTFRNAHELREVARYVPLERLLIETDAPYLAPVPHRGKENQPAYVRDVAEYLAVLKGISLADLAHQTSQNFCDLFQIRLPSLATI